MGEHRCGSCLFVMYIVSGTMPFFDGGFLSNLTKKVNLIENSCQILQRNAIFDGGFSVKFDRETSF